MVRAQAGRGGVNRQACPGEGGRPRTRSGAAGAIQAVLALTTAGRWDDPRRHGVKAGGSHPEGVAGARAWGAGRSGRATPPDEFEPGRLLANRPSSADLLAVGVRDAVDLNGAGIFDSGAMSHAPRTFRRMGVEITKRPDVFSAIWESTLPEDIGQSQFDDC